MEPLVIIRKLSKVGKSQGISIPHEIVEYLKLKGDETLKIKVKDWIFSKKLIKSGNSIWLLLPTSLLKEHNIKLGDIILIEVMDIRRGDNNEN